MSGNYNSGDVIFDELSLTTISTGNKMDITGQVAAISLFEDMNAPFLYAEVAMTDAIGIRSTFPIVGEELLTLTFTTPGRDSYTTILHCYSVSDVKPNTNSTKHGYILKCISPEAMMNANVTVQKGYNTTISSIIQDIIANSLNSKKKFIYEPTKGTQQIVYPRMSPFRAIKMAVKRACSTTNKSSSYFFFENKYGYNLNTLENLMLKNSAAIGDKTFTKYTATGGELEPGIGFRTIHQYTVGTQMDLMNAIDIGALNNVHQTFDLLTKTFTETPYNLSKFNQFASSDPKGAVSPVTPTIYSKYGSGDPVRFFNVSDSSKPDTFINDFFGYKIGFLSLQMAGLVDIYVSGDSSISAGDCITIEIPKTDGLTKTTIEEEPLQNGNYIVSKVHHQFKISALKPKYTQTLGLIRGTYRQN